MREFDLVVIGGGAAGMAAALGAHEKGLKKILIVERDHEYGGILQQCIHNGFGLHTFNEELSGPSYAQKYHDLIKDIPDIEMQFETMVDKIEKDLKVSLQSKNGYETIQAKSVVIATGCKERSAGGIALQGDRCQGVYTAGCAQKYLNMGGFMVGKKVFILGSGDIGLIMARRMTLEGAKVIGVAELMPYSNGLARNIKQCLEDFDIPLYLSHTVVAVHGKPRLKSITLAAVDENRQPIESSKQEIECDCLLLSIGLIPEINLLEELGVELDPRTKGAVINDQHMTSVEGVFACGNALHVHDLVDFVSLEAKATGADAAEYVLSNKVNERKIKCKQGNGIGYTVPQYASADKDVEFAFRVRNIYKKAKIHVYGGDLDKSINKLSLVPSEMVKVNLTKEELQKVGDELTWEVVE